MAQRVDNNFDLEMLYLYQWVEYHTLTDPTPEKINKIQNLFIRLSYEFLDMEVFRAEVPPPDH